MSQATSQEIRALTTLPAIREEIILHTKDGLDLVGELASPIDAEIAATLVTFHPLPTHGGFMDSHLYRKASLRLPALANIAVLRFNTRGTSSPRGLSGGHFEEGIGEIWDVDAAMEFVRERNLPNPWMIGWSFGTELVLKYGTIEPAKSVAKGAILLSPPLHRATDVDLEKWNSDSRPLIVIVPELDDYLQPKEAKMRFSIVEQAHVIGVDGAKHLWVGEKYTTRVLNEIVAAVLPSTALAKAGLPTHFEL